ncbi:MAG: TonB-dependent receptor plug domain-containing protein, partial [Flavobacteriales bacterium]|nr:TonB-dependent receptor plug domain-containing protein [Flavobacteriales bacterium]
MVTSKIGYAQDSLSNKTFLLPEFSVSEKLDKMLSKINTQEIDSQLISYHNTGNLSTLISKNSAVSIRSYGVTGISSVAIRGGNANHTAVLWNGFNIQDPLNGGFNFSTSTSNFVDDINIQYGGTSAAFGSGAVGGTIHLNNTAIFNRNIYGSVLYKSGSFGLQSSQFEAGFGNNKIASRVRFFGQTTNNNFEFINRTKINHPQEIYENAELKQIGFLHEFYYRPTTNQQISSQFWFQDNYREVPPNISSEPNENEEEYQQDNWYRWALNWNKKGKIVNWEARNGVFYNQSEYIKTSINLSSIN